MKKIPTLFKRDPENMKYVLPEVHPDCQWVLDGEGVATRKYDGTCVLFGNGQWWARREVKPGKTPPPNYWPVETDSTTGKTVGWEPIAQSPFFKAFQYCAYLGLDEGTYELVGPKINGNPEGFPDHRLIPHASAEVFAEIAMTVLDFETCRRVVLDLGEKGFEGIVWHHPDGRMAKLKARDFGRSS